MPYAMVPPGYRAVLLGQAAAIEELGTFAPLEQDSAEGALFLVRLDFAEFPSGEASGSTRTGVSGCRGRDVAGL